jgi:uncharacterized Zn-binding protein involved in type VI secretion
VEPVSDAAAPPPELGRTRSRLGLYAVGAIVALALIETAVSLIAPLRAPTDANWAAAERDVRAGFQPGDLIVAAPAWADPIMRMHLGDLIPLATAGRMDGARYGRVWEIDQRGARAPEGRDGRVVAETRHGALTVRRVERSGAAVSYDFLARWNDAHVSRVAASGAAIPCPFQGDRFQCPQIGFNYVKRQIVEVDTTLRQALLAQPVDGARVVVEFPAVRLGREIAVATGLSNVWMRKAAAGTVDLTVAIDGQPALRVTTSNRNGWLISHVDTAARAGQTATVRFEVTSPAPYARYFAFAAEARS